MTVLAPIVGTGTDDDPYRSVVADLVVDHVAEIATDKAGAPIDATCVTTIPDDTPDAKLFAMQLAGCTFP